MAPRRSLIMNGLSFLVGGIAASSVIGARQSVKAQDAESLTVSVFGATGRTGEHVVNDLIKRGHIVRGISRSAGRREPRPGVQWISADVLRPETLSTALNGADAVIYAVGVDFTQVEAQDLYDVYHTGVADTAAEAKRTDVQRFVHLSSAGRVRPNELPQELRASTDSKAKGEAALREFGIGYSISRAPRGLESARR